MGSCKPRKHRLAQVAFGGSWLALLPCLPSVTLVRPSQWIHGLASLWVWPAGLSSSSRSFNNMRIIVSLGWAIYPAGYFLGQVNKSASAAQALNVTYNIADFVNKIAFVLACWSCAKSDSEAGRKSEPLLA